MHDFCCEDSARQIIFTKDLFYPFVVDNVFTGLLAAKT